jgi:putative nucleotidyltransferase with HDIG domain
VEFGVTRSRIVLFGLSPKFEGLRWESDTRLLIGRLGNDLDIVLDDPSVSRRHAEVAASYRGWVVRDLGSANGTLLNGVPLGKNDEPLRPNDTIQCGKLLLGVTLEHALETALALAGVEGAHPPYFPLNPDPPANEPLGQFQQMVSAGSGEETLLRLEGAKAPGSSSRIRTSGAFLRIQARAHHSWQQALERVTIEGPQGKRQGKHLLTLLRTGHHLCNVASLDDLLQAILDDAVAALDAQRGCIVLADGVTDQLAMRALAEKKRMSRLGRSYSKTLAERCFHNGESLLCADVNADADLTSASSIQVGKMASIVCALLRSPRQKLGVLHLDRGPFQEPFNEEEFYLIDAIAASVSVAIESAQLVETQRDQFIQTITALARTVEVRDQSTANHTQRVTEYSLLLADQLDLSPAQRQHLLVGTPLHDIGKIGIQDAILLKPDRLTLEEFELMKSHTVKGAAILEPIPALAPVIPIVRSHHERWDGQGYPDGLGNDRINLLARIVAVADAFDAMTSTRPYRPAMPVEKALAELAAKAGSHFDPACVNAFLAVPDRIKAIIPG